MVKRSSRQASILMQILEASSDHKGYRAIREFKEIVALQGSSVTRVHVVTSALRGQRVKLVPRAVVDR